MLEALTSLIALQALDTAADTARKRIAEMPALEKALDKTIADSKAVVDGIKARLAENETSRRALEKETALIDGRMAKFEDHKASVKTNQEFHALNHEIEVAQASKSVLDDQVLELMAAAEDLVTQRKTAEATLATVTAEAEKQRAVLRAERAALDADLARLTGERTAATPSIPAPALAKYEQIAKSRKGIAVSAMVNGICTGCHVRLRPNVEQQVRKADALTQCDNCQRILHYVAPPKTDASPTDGASPVNEAMGQ
jgi:predicted  nucleic acid-binding Zn-ribbon protein